MADTDKHWEKWGQEDPYYAVVTWDKFHRANIENSRSEFFETGEIFIAEITAQLERVAGRPLNKARALDFGSGVGRLTIPLARRYAEAVGIDISDAMIAEAKKNCEQFGITNANFVKSDDTLSRATGKFDLVMSFIVLQHIPLERGYNIIAQLLDRVAPGGAVMLHFSVRRTLSPAKRLVYFAKNRIPGARYVFNILQGRPLSTPTMQMNEYDLLAVVKEFEKRGMRYVTVARDPHPTAETAMLFACSP